MIEVENYFMIAYNHKEMTEQSYLSNDTNADTLSSNDGNISPPTKAIHTDTSMVIRDLIVVALLTVCATFLLIKFDAWDWFHSLTRKWEEWDLDEMMLGFVVFSIGVTWFAYRRWRSASHEIMTRKLVEIQLRKAYNGELLSAAHKAGMAEVASGVLHNVGNVLNSVGVTVSSINNVLENSRLSYLEELSKLLAENKSRLGDFMERDERGRKIPIFIENLNSGLLKERAHLLESAEKLTRHVAHIKEIINLQQSHGKRAGVQQKTSINELVEDALMINSQSLMRHQIRLEKKYADIPLLSLDRTRVLQILTNLISNAKYALAMSEKRDKVLSLRTSKSGGVICVDVEDNGIGISPQQKERIFDFGYTTREDGHGFGLHSGILAAGEMGGSLSLYSDGEGKGARFRLELSIAFGEN